MSALGSSIPGARVVDLFAGSGALGLEALSRGAASVTFVEKAREALSALEANIGVLAAGARTRIVRDDAFRFLSRTPAGSFDIALADPPYGEGYAARLLELAAATPFARELWVEHHSREVIPDLPGLIHRRYGDTTLTIWELLE